MKQVETGNSATEDSGKLKNAFFIQQETFCGSAVPDQAFYVLAVNS